MAIPRKSLLRRRRCRTPAHRLLRRPRRGRRRRVPSRLSLPQLRRRQPNKTPPSAAAPEGSPDCRSRRIRRLPSRVRAGDPADAGSDRGQAAGARHATAGKAGRYRRVARRTENDLGSSDESDRSQSQELLEFGHYDAGERGRQTSRPGVGGERPERDGDRVERGQCQGIRSAWCCRQS